MQRYLLNRLLQGLFTLLAMSMLVFVMARATGDPLALMLDPWATEEDRARISRELGLDQPLPVQYGVFLVNAVQGNLGRSLRNNRPVIERIGTALPNTLKLGFGAIIIGTLLAVPLGVISAVKRDSWLDKAGKVVAVLGQSVPNFWLGIVLIMFFSVSLRLLPAGGSGTPQHFVLPAITLGWFVVAGVMRLVRSGMLDVLDSEYVRLARAKGVPERLVIWKHCLKNAIAPALTFAAVVFVYALVGGSVIVETVFAWPGIGRLAYESVMFHDFPMIQGIVLIFSAIFILVNLAVDVLYAYLDPRVRYD